jgi:hypothetical protein
MRTTRTRVFFGIVLSLSLFLGFAVHARSEWLLTEDELIVVLTRVDPNPVTPHHEIDHGRYGYYTQTMLFVPVLDFSTTNDILPPFTWHDVEWIPGPLDADSTGQPPN